ncbi:MAG: hypothetical protein ABSB91_08925 [Sedimentisphaerales bacterium]|jgi:hypothetical protein
MAEFQGKSGNQDNNKSIPFNNGLSISHSPLNLGGGSAAPAPEPEAEERPVIKDTGKKVSWPDRITGVRTFFTKLHAGAIEFLDEQICKWLMDNPGVTIKMTNTTVGEVAAKKTEPNIIITVWF